MSRVPDVLVEQLALGELPPARAAEVRQRLADEPGGLARLDALRASDEAILRAHPPRVVALRLLPRRPSRLWVLAPALAAAGLALFIWPRDAVPPERPVHDVLRVKGDPQLLVDRKVAGGTEALADGAQAAPGDLLQLGYVAAGAAHGVLLSIDGRGGVSLHFPPDPGGDTALTAGGPQRLAFSVELDDAPGFERFVLVTAEQPLDVAAVLAAARAAGADPAAPLGLPPGAKAKELIVRKPGAGR